MYTKLTYMYIYCIYIHFSSPDFQTTKLSDRSLYGFYKFMSKLKQTSNAQNFSIKITIATFRHPRVFFRQKHNYKTNRATKCTCCSISSYTKYIRIKTLHGASRQLIRLSQLWCCGHHQGVLVQSITVLLLYIYIYK